MQQLPRGSQTVKSGIGFEMMVLCYGSAYERLRPNCQAACDRARKRRWSFTTVPNTLELLMKSVGSVQYAEPVGASRLCSAPVSQSPTAAGSDGTGGTESGFHGSESARIPFRCAFSPLEIDHVGSVSCRVEAKLFEPLRGGTVLAWLHGASVQQVGRESAKVSKWIRRHAWRKSCVRSRSKASGCRALQNSVVLTGTASAG
jgi:hypothetical protein